MEQVTTTSDSFILIGKILRCHGLHGDMRMKSLSDIPDRFVRLANVYVGRDSTDMIHLAIDHIIQRGEFVQVRFHGKNSRTDAEALVGQYVFVHESDKLSPPEGKHFIDDLLGMDVVSRDGKYRGVLKDVWNLPAQDVYVVHVKQREVLIPAVPAFVFAVDMKHRQITVNAIEGLFEDDDEN